MSSNGVPTALVTPANLMQSAAVCVHPQLAVPINERRGCHSRSIGQAHAGSECTNDPAGAHHLSRARSLRPASGSTAVLFDAAACVHSRAAGAQYSRLGQGSAAEDDCVTDAEAPHPDAPCDNPHPLLPTPISSPLPPTQGRRVTRTGNPHVPNCVPVLPLQCRNHSTSTVPYTPTPMLAGRPARRGRRGRTAQLAER